MSNKPRIVVITGPTATGKTSLAVFLAQRLAGEIVNADSMQVYRYMDIGTAKPGPEERGSVPHHLIDVVDPDETFHAARYRSMALAVIRDILARGKRCFLVGGTGLYIKTLLGGLLHCPPADPVIRKRLEIMEREQGTARLYERLGEFDPDAAERIHPNDRVRIIRALEMIQLTGRTASSLMREHGFEDRPFQALKFCLYLERKQLYDRINRRSEEMIRKGLLQETKDLLARGYSPDLKPMKSIGYRHMIRVLEGTWEMEEALEKLQADTRRYAKRQITWFKADPEMVWIMPEETKRTEAAIQDFYEKTVPGPCASTG